MREGERVRKRAKSEQGGMRGRGSGRAGLGLNAPLRFGVLMENCGRAEPTAAAAAAAVRGGLSAKQTGGGGGEGAGQRETRGREGGGSTNSPRSAEVTDGF